MYAVTGPCRKACEQEYGERRVRGRNEKEKEKVARVGSQKQFLNGLGLGAHNLVRGPRDRPLVRDGSGTRETASQA